MTDDAFHPLRDESADGDDDGVLRYRALASGLTRAALGTTERLLAGFVRQGEVAADHAERLLDDVIARSVESGGALAQLVRSEIERGIEHAGLVRAQELDRTRAQLHAELEQLRAEVRAVRGEQRSANGAGVANQ